MLEAVERQIEHYINDLEDADARQLYSRLPAGKRLRARLILTIAGSGLSAVKTAAIVEMIHAASLLHDDVIDDAYTRRGRPSINALYGNKTSIMFGDVLYSKAFYELVDIDRQVARSIANAVVLLSLGERQDVLLSESFNPDRDAYLKMIYQKTAALIEAAAESAAILAGKDREAYRTYGRNLGIAFQMIDDILDITQSAEALGKPAMHDFEEGKTTLPYIYLYEALDEPDRKRLLAMHRQPVTGENAEWIRERMARTGALERARDEAKALIEEAIALMRREGEPELEALAMKMIERNY
ncbi:polyprenyl synthetase family protein [Nitratifractor salsuginis]|uniref:Polyprenyl synthetase n=1 Tax=Nitratifractor salsuginis (strain DSM 16511 / JCM 12458 / E9I37-1) TaxID=749222 RepID=E6X315_NITSE|nr:polyprenyl synthetase family protein [Nitratifractor salsuginis]ADV46159.1 Polyprenyl synthetase [Nitratifractor salsuginis DSM 16511]